jgi:glycine cleavage system aminomethyltransferase T
VEFHRKNGTHLGTWFGCELPDDFGDWREEYRLARESVALIDKNYRAYLDFTGPDRVRYLNAILTNSIKGLADHRGTVSLFLNPQGHIQAEIETYAYPDKLCCISFAVIRERLIAAIDKYIIMDDVTQTDVTEAYGTLALEGPKAAECTAKLTGLEIAKMAELEVLESRVGAIPCSVIKRTPAAPARTPRSC